MQAKINSSALHGVDAFRVTIEVSIDKGLGVIITGLPDDGIKESYNRISVALAANGFIMPRTKLVINLSPAGVRKTGTAFDLPIAIAILLASEQLSDLGKLNDYLLAGELSLDGSIQPIRGTLCMSHQALRDGLKGLVVPYENAQEASLVKGVEIYAVKNLQDVVDFIQSDSAFAPFTTYKHIPVTEYPLDFAEVKGQRHVKRALEITAAGGHNALMIGPPGSSKTMLAQRIPSILPPMTGEESMETTRIYSVSNVNINRNSLITERPFRNPHHTCSDAALVGGGGFPAPGEISLAHNGILFLDELGEFKRSVMEVLRQPLEDGKVLIARAQSTLEFPASFTLLAAMNPCNCGYFGHPSIPCTCSKAALWWYRRKISGPMLQRIDLHIMVDPVPFDSLFKTDNEETSQQIRKRIVKARNIQSRRYKDLPGIHSNAKIPDALIQKFCPLEPAAINFIGRKMEELHFSARSFSRILKVARTIADLAAKDSIELEHIAEAIHYRSLDKPLTISAPQHSTQKKQYT